MYCNSTIHTLTDSRSTLIIPIKRTVITLKIRHSGAKGFGIKHKCPCLTFNRHTLQSIPPVEMVQVFVTSLPANQSLSAFSKLACDAGELQPVRKSAVLDVFLHRSCQSKSFIAKHVITCKPCSLSIKCPCHLKTRRGAAGCPRPPSCPYVVTTAPPRTGAAGCRGWAGGGGCCCLDC